MYVYIHLYPIGYFLLHIPYRLLLPTVRTGASRLLTVCGFGQDCCLQPGSQRHLHCPGYRAKSDMCIYIYIHVHQNYIQ